MREHKGHLVCDECDGILVSEHDLAASVHELDGKDEPIVARPTADADAHCPRCAELMQTCDLSLGAHPLGGGFLRCPRDGVWMPRDVLASLYAWAGRRAHEQEAHPRPHTALLQSLFAGRGRTGRSSLIISQPQRAWPKTHTVFVSALRGNRLTCPNCSGQPLSFQGDRWACASCQGSFVENTALIEMVTAMTGSPWELPAPSGEPGARKCPACGGVMVAETVEHVDLDRCPRHGLWFDAEELQTVLEHAGLHKP